MMHMESYVVMQDAYSLIVSVCDHRVAVFVLQMHTFYSSVRE